MLDRQNSLIGDNGEIIIAKIPFAEKRKAWIRSGAVVATASIRQCFDR
jgi:hypothetical protein